PQPGRLPLGPEPHGRSVPNLSPAGQGAVKNRRKSRSRRGNEADRRRAEAALFRLRLWLRRDRVVAKRRRRRDAKAEVFFAPKSASLGFVQKQVPDRKRISTKAPLTLTLSRPMGDLFSVLLASCRQNKTMRDRTLCRRDAGSTLERHQEAQLNTYPTGK